MTKIDWPDIVCEDDFKRINKQLHLDQRKFKCISLTRIMVYEDSKFYRMNPNEYSVKLRVSMLKDIEVLFNLVKSRGWQNIFFISREELAENLCISSSERTLRYKISNLKSNNIIRVYDKNDGVKGGLLKVCVNPVHAFKWQDKQIKHQHFTNEELYSVASSLFGTERINEGQLPSAITSGVYSAMNNARKKWDDVKSLQDFQDDIQIQLAINIGATIKYQDTPTGVRPYCCVNHCGRPLNKIIHSEIPAPPPYSKLPFIGKE